MDHAELIRRSLRAHVLAWIGFVPVLGLPCAIFATMDALRCQRASRTQWNPAARYILGAAILASFAVILQLVGFAWLGTVIAEGGNGD